MQPRIWTPEHDDGSVHAMGNGELLAYGCGPNLKHLFGPPYSSPDLLQLRLVDFSGLRCESIRKAGAPLWHHTLTRGAERLVASEFVVPDVPAYVRRFGAEGGTFAWELLPHAGTLVLPQQPLGEWQATLLMLPAGVGKIYIYPDPAEHWTLLLTRGACRLVQRGEAWRLEAGEGRGEMIIAGGTTWPAAVEVAQAVTARGAEALQSESVRASERYLERCRAVRPRLATLPPAVAEVAENVTLLIQAQQAKDGGLMAGEFFPLAYLRDQYGTARGMLALGMLEGARRNLEFRRAKFARFGNLLNAESMGCDSARHNHENDDVEGPGYNMLQVRDYLAAVPDDVEFGRSLWPMLEWCWQAQCRHVVNGLLPFNGDETYVAGGFFPRSGLLQGSADATLVFAECGLWLADWATREGLWNAEQAAEARALAEASHAAWRRHFLRGERVVANAPERERAIEPPRFRHGVCEGGAPWWFGWTERSVHGRYLSPARIAAGADLPAEHPEPLEVNSVALLPCYLGSAILSRGEQAAIVEHVLNGATRHGYVPSLPGHPGTVGYDAGLLTLNLHVLGDARARAAGERLLALLDGAQAWVEYYEDEGHARATCCRCRPWESGINIEALLALH